MDALALIFAVLALVVAIRNKRTVVVQREQIETNIDAVKDIARQVVDRHEQQFHRR